MSSMFIWGASLGFILRATTNRSMRKPFTNTPWKYVTSSLGLGSIFHFVDWTRRVNLETNCINEEIMDHQKQKIFLDTIAVGEEFSDEKLVEELAVKAHRL